MNHKIPFDNKTWFNFWLHRMQTSWQVLAGLQLPIGERYRLLLIDIEMSPEQYDENITTRYKEIFGDLFTGGVPLEFTMIKLHGWLSWQATPPHVQGALMARHVIEGMQSVLEANDREDVKAQRKVKQNIDKGTGAWH